MMLLLSGRRFSSRLAMCRRRYLLSGCFMCGSSAFVGSGTVMHFVRLRFMMTTMALFCTALSLDEIERCNEQEHEDNYQPERILEGYDRFILSTV